LIIKETNFDINNSKKENSKNNNNLNNKNFIKKDLTENLNNSEFYKPTLVSVGLKILYEEKNKSTMESLLTKNTLFPRNKFIEKLNVFNYENELLSNNNYVFKKNNLTANSKINSSNINNISEFKINFSFNNNNYNNTNKPLSSLINQSNKQSNVFISVFNNNFEKKFIR